MDRREAIKALGLSAGLWATPALGGPRDRVRHYGASKPGQPVWGNTFYQTFGPMKGLARETAKEGKNVFLYENLEEQIGEIVPHWQGPDPESGAPGEGDCVGQAGAMGVDVLAATDIHLQDEPEEWLAKASVEMAYAGSRIEIGRDGRPKENPEKANWIAGRGGSHGGWMARFFNEYGVLHRVVYDDKKGQRLDLSGYDPGRSRKYRDIGVPDWLEEEARQHPVKTVTNPQSGEEALDAVCARQPVIMCSSYAFMDTRDSQGFCKAFGAERGRWGRWSRYQWWHAMILTGALFEGGRVGGLIQNSHGDWNTGPRPHGIPRGSFFVDLATLDLMVKDWFDCWALGSYKGHETKKIRKRIHKLWR